MFQQGRVRLSVSSAVIRPAKLFYPEKVLEDHATSDYVINAAPLVAHLSSGMDYNNRR